MWQGKKGGFRKGNIITSEVIVRLKTKILITLYENAQGKHIYEAEWITYLG